MSERMRAFIERLFFCSGTYGIKRKKISIDSVDFDSEISCLEPEMIENIPEEARSIVQGKVKQKKEYSDIKQTENRRNKEVLSSRSNNSNIMYSGSRIYEARNMNKNIDHQRIEDSDYMQQQNIYKKDRDSTERQKVKNSGSKLANSIIVESSQETDNHKVSNQILENKIKTGEKHNTIPVIENRVHSQNSIESIVQNSRAKGIYTNDRYDEISRPKSHQILTNISDASSTVESEASNTLIIKSKKGKEDETAMSRLLESIENEHLLDKSKVDVIRKKKEHLEEDSSLETSLGSIDDFIANKSEEINRKMHRNTDSQNNEISTTTVIESQANNKTDSTEEEEGTQETEISCSIAVYDKKKFNKILLKRLKDLLKKHKDSMNSSYRQTNTKK